MVFRTTLFRKQLGILLLVTIVFAGIAMLVSDIAVRAMMSWTSKEDTTGGPTQGLVRLIDELTNDGKLTLDEAVEKLNRAGPRYRIQRVRVVDAKTLDEEFHVDPSHVPVDPFQAFSLQEKELRFPRLIVFRAKVDPGRYLVFEREAHEGPGHGPGGPPPPPGMGGHGPGGPRPPPIFMWTFAALVLSGFLAAAISLFLLFSSMRQKARQAAEVIAAIKQGDWHKRMPIDGVDEVGHLMQEFNRMADEIESAVRSMQRAEASRTGLLQDLAHDLRTPIASLRGLIETLEMRNDSLTPKSRAELFSLAQNEIDYFARLVEDLLFLAQVRDPRYLNSGTTVDLTQILRDQVERAQTEGKSEVSLSGDVANAILMRGDEVLLKRLIRNSIDNAVSFAKSAVSISVERDTPGFVKIKIADDGPGFTDQSLQTFGEKRFSRFIAAGEGERLSVGLGSVIMTTVANVHGGKVEARNVDADGQRVGAEVLISLPVS